MIYLLFRKIIKFRFLKLNIEITKFNLVERKI